MGHIIDISHHQDPARMDYDRLAKVVDHVIIRTQYGSRRVDRHYRTHHKAFQSRGIPTSAYAWVRGISIGDMEQEARDFYQRTVEFAPEVWYLDVEERSMKDMRSGVSAYVRQLRKLGAERVGIYIGHHLYRLFNLNLDEADVIWIPHYGRNTGKVDSKPAYPCDLHQYTSKGRLDGYDGYLDLNRRMDRVKEVQDTYSVQAGDTLWGISKIFGVTIRDLVEWNGIRDPNLIRVGQVLRIKDPAGASKGDILYRIRPGDTLSEIAQRYGVRMGDIVKLNGIQDPDKIYAGDKLLIPRR